MKILYVSTVKSHIGQFHLPFINCLLEDGHEVHAAFRDNSNDKPGLDVSIINRIYEIPFEREPFKLKNIKAYFKLKKIIRDENYDIIHCHTPMGAMITRLAALKTRKKGAKVIYTAHGFHFYKGASKKNWVLYYHVEKLLAKFTDCLILINEEDYSTAKVNNFKTEKIYKTHGVGVDITKFNRGIISNKNILRNEYGYSEKDFILLYPADLSYRKNQKMLFDTISLLKDTIPNLKLLLPGQPVLLEEYKKYACELGIQDRVEFMGYRRDIPDLLAVCDVAVSSSRQEGLPINIVEAMAMGKPIVATNVRGNQDLIDDALGGYLIELNDCREMADRILKLYNNTEILKKMGEYNIVNVKKFSTESVINELKKIYREINSNFFIES